MRYRFDFALFVSSAGISKNQFVNAKDSNQDELDRQAFPA